MGRIRSLIDRLRTVRRMRRHPNEGVGERAFDSWDALTSGRAGDTGDGQFGGMPPPSWVKDYDDGRPRT